MSEKISYQIRALVNGTYNVIRLTKRPIPEARWWHVKRFTIQETSIGNRGSLEYAKDLMHSDVLKRSPYEVLEVREYDDQGQSADLNNYI